MMNKLKLLAAAALCMAYAAGIATGWAGSTLAGEAPPPPRDRGSWLSHELGLNDAQKAQMEAIWTRELPGPEGDERARVRALYDERNARVRELLTEPQRESFDAIYRECDEKRDAIYAERRKRHDDAVAKTMAILDPAQQEKYKAILADFEKRGPGRDSDRAPRPKGPTP